LTFPFSLLLSLSGLDGADGMAVVAAVAPGATPRMEAVAGIRVVISFFFLLSSRSLLLPLPRRLAFSSLFSPSFSFALFLSERSPLPLFGAFKMLLGAFLAALLALISSIKGVMIGGITPPVAAAFSFSSAMRLSNCISALGKVTVGSFNFSKKRR